MERGLSRHNFFRYMCVAPVASVVAATGVELLKQDNLPIELHDAKIHPLWQYGTTEAIHVPSEADTVFVESRMVPGLYEGTSPQVLTAKDKNNDPIFPLELLQTCQKDQKTIAIFDVTIDPSSLQGFRTIQDVEAVAAVATTAIGGSYTVYKRVTQSEGEKHHPISRRNLLCLPAFMYLFYPSFATHMLKQNGMVGKLNTDVNAVVQSLHPESQLVLELRNKLCALKLFEHGKREYNSSGKRANCALVMSAENKGLRGEFSSPTQLRQELLSYSAESWLQVLRANGNTTLEAIQAICTTRYIQIPPGIDVKKMDQHTTDFGSVIYVDTELQQGLQNVFGLI
ncbi:hypothetical protein HGA88_05505 [Candidatus Roizmanbacteria bacterium]|nr:hypothetical protein [Candidatus Roizmanbacteria bacterium]